MLDQEMDSAGLAKTPENVQDAPVPATTPAPRFSSLDDAIAKIEAAHFTKIRPTPICWDGTTWLVSGYLRAPTHIKYNLWETEWDLSKGIWNLTDRTTTFTYPDYEQLKMEGMNDGK